MTHTAYITGPFKEIINWLSTNVSPLSGAKGLRKFSGKGWMLLVVSVPVDFFTKTGYVEAYQITINDSDLIVQLQLTFTMIDR